jgi:hypothetical protein
MVEVPTPAETRKFWGLSSLFSTSIDRLMQMILGGFGGGGGTDYGMFVTFVVERELTKWC